MLKCLVLRFFLLFPIILLETVSAQIPYFEKNFGGQGTDIAYSIAQSPDSTVFLFGYTLDSSGNSDFALNKLNASGDLLWSKKFGTPLVDFGIGMTMADTFNIVMVGTTPDSANPLETDILLLKTDSAGNELWRRKFGTAGNDYAKTVCRTYDGGFVLCGYSPDIFGSIDSYIIRTDSNGNKLWETFIGGSQVETGDRAIVLPESDIIVTSTTTESGNSDVRLTRLTDSGVIVWDTISMYPDEDGSQGVIFDSHNRLLVFGETQNAPFAPFEFFIQAFDTSGNELWRNTFGGAGANAIFDLLENPDGDLVGTGYSNTASSGSAPLNAVFFKTDSLGSLLWQKEYGGSGIDIAYSICRSFGGGYYMAGRYAAADDDFFIIHADENGLTALLEANSLSPVSIVMSPNPVKSTLTISTDKNLYEVKIYSVSGSQLRNIKAATDNHLLQIDLSDLPNGLYLLSALLCSQEIVNRRFIVIH